MVSTADFDSASLGSNPKSSAILALSVVCTVATSTFGETSRQSRFESDKVMPWSHRLSVRTPRCQRGGRGSTPRETAISGCGEVWSSRLPWKQEIAGSSPAIPTIRTVSSVVEHRCEIPSVSGSNPLLSTNIVE